MGLLTANTHIIRCIKTSTAHSALVPRALQLFTFQPQVKLKPLLTFAAQNEESQTLVNELLVDLNLALSTSAPKEAELTS